MPTIEVFKYEENQETKWPTDTRINRWDHFLVSDKVTSFLESLPGAFDVYRGTETDWIHIEYYLKGRFTCNVAPVFVVAYRSGSGFMWFYFDNDPSDKIFQWLIATDRKMTVKTVMEA